MAVQEQFDEDNSRLKIIAGAERGFDFSRKEPS